MHCDVAQFLLMFADLKTRERPQKLAALLFIDEHLANGVQQAATSRVFDVSQYHFSHMLLPPAE